MRVRQRHQHHAANARLEVLRREPLQPAERLVERADDALDRDLPEIGAEVRAHLAGVVARPLGGEAGRHRDRVDVLGTQRVGGDSGRQRRVDAAGDADHDVGEAVLRDVVAETEPEAEPHLLESGRERCHGRSDRLVDVARRGEPDRRSRGGLRPRALELAPAHVAEPPSDRLGRVDVDDQQRLLESRRAGDDLALVVEDDRVPVEDELVLPPDEVAERDVARVVPCPRDEHLLAVLRLAHEERRGREVDEHRGARERKVGRRRAGLPDVLADRRTDEHVAHLEEEELAAAGEVPVLVEHAVVREEVLPVDPLHGAVRTDEGGVREIAVERRRADERREVDARAGDLVDGLAGGADERGAKEEILRRVTRHGELGKDDEVGRRAPRVRERGDDALHVPVEVADDDVHLGEDDPHRRILASPASCPLLPGFRL